MIESFTGEYRFLSNFFLTSTPIVYNNINFPSVEHAYQAAKTLSVEQQVHIAATGSPSEAKSIGRTIPLRPDWEDIKVDVMYGLVKQKFTNSFRLNRMLRATGSIILVEGNTWHDNFWGVCKCSKCCGRLGSNYLGEILMLVRSEL